MTIVGGYVKALVIDQRASGTNNSYGFTDGIKIVKNSKSEKAKEITAFIDGKKVTVQNGQRDVLC